MLALKEFQKEVMAEEDFIFFRDHIHDIAGIWMPLSKRELLTTRLKHRLNSLSLASFQDYRQYLTRLGKQDPEWQFFINLLTTNKTDFFREPRHFDYLSTIIVPQWLKTAPKAPFKVWSCASSTGEEPYSISMTLHRELLPEREYGIDASDIDTKVLQKAANGVYKSSVLYQIPDEYQSYFSRGTGEISEWVRIRPDVKNRIDFFQFNLIKSAPPKAEYDLIFCRNVLIYFNPATIEQVIAKLYTAAKPGGYLFIGHSESLQTINHEWIQVTPSIYRKGK